MKRILQIIWCISVSCSFAQLRQGALLHDFKKPGSLPLFSTAFCDTATNVNFNSDSAVVYTNTGTGNWGYVSGTNSYKDISKVEKFFSGSYTAGYQLAGGVFYFSRAVDGNDSSQMKISVWDDDGIGSYPKTLLGTQLVNVSDFKSDSLYTTLMFSQPVPVQGDFYFGIDGFTYDSPQSDTVVLYTSTKNVPANTAYERWVDSSWHAFSEPNNWNFKSRFFIAAILCNTEVGEYEVVNHSGEPVVFPNPADNKLYVHSGVSNNNLHGIKIIDANGRLVLLKTTDIQSSQECLDISFLSSGFYQVIISTAAGNYSRKMLVQ